MKKLLLVSLLTLSTSIFASPNIGISVQSPIGNNSMIDINFRSDDHRYDNRYKNFDYNRKAYRDDFGYYFGYFDRTGYFYNNIFFLYDNRYSYNDRLHLRGYFKPSHPHYREYRYHKNHDWNRSRKYRNDREPIYGHYYNKSDYKNHKDYEKQRYKDHKNEIKRHEKREKERYKEDKERYKENKKHYKEYNSKNNDYRNDRNQNHR